MSLHGLWWKRAREGSGGVVTDDARNRVARADEGAPREPQDSKQYPLLAPYGDQEFCNALGVNGSGDMERCIREKGHDGEHVGMGSG